MEIKRAFQSPAAHKNVPDSNTIDSNEFVGIVTVGEAVNVPLGDPT